MHDPDSVFNKLQVLLLDFLSQEERSSLMDRFSTLGYVEGSKEIALFYYRLLYQPYRKKDKLFVEGILVKALGRPYREAVLKHPALVRSIFRAGQAAYQSDPLLRRCRLRRQRKPEQGKGDPLSVILE